MKHLKKAGILVVAAAALAAFASSASATTLTSNGVNLGVGSTISAVKEGTHISLTGPLGIAVECQEVNLSAQVTNSGSSSATVKANVTVFTLDKCTNGYEVHVVSKGTLELHSVSPTGNATITSSGLTIDVTNVPFAGTCAYRTENTDIGLMTGSLSTKGTATIDLSASIPRHGGSALCGSTGTLHGLLLVTAPDNLDAH